MAATARVMAATARVMAAHSHGSTQHMAARRWKLWICCIAALVSVFSAGVAAEDGNSPGRLPLGSPTNPHNNTSRLDRDNSFDGKSGDSAEIPTVDESVSSGEASPLIVFEAHVAPCNSLSCKGSDDWPRSTWRVPCYCDSLCLLHGDCCVDYFARLQEKKSDGDMDTNGFQQDEDTGTPSFESSGGNDTKSKSDIEKTKKGGDAEDTHVAGGKAKGGSKEGGQPEKNHLEGDDTADDHNRQRREAGVEVGMRGGESEDDELDTSPGNDGSNTESPTASQESKALEEKFTRTLLHHAPSGVSPYAVCTPISSLTSTLRGFLLISKCPNQESNESSAQSPCLNRETLRPQDYFLVVDEGTRDSAGRVFINPRCAACHGLALNANNVKTIAPGFQCEDRKREAEGILSEQGLDAFLSFVTQNCSPLYEIASIKRYECPLDVQYVHRCNQSSPENNASLLCDLYTHPVTFPSSSAVYKNPHCAVCNGVLNTEDLVCSTPPQNSSGNDAAGSAKVPLPSFSLLMDFSGGVSGVSFNHRKVCPAGTYHNLGTDECIADLCDAGLVAVDGVCIRINFSLTPLLTEGNQAVVFLLETELNGDEVKRPLLVMNQLPTDTLLLDAWVDLETATSFAKSWNTLNWSPHDDNNTYVVLQYNSSSLAGTEQYEKLQNIGRQIQKASGATSRIFFFNHWPEGVDNECPSGSSHVTRSVQVTEDVTNGLYFLDKGTGLKLPFLETPVVICWEGNKNSTENFDSWSMQSLAVYCQPELVTCEKVLLPPDEYTVVDGKVTVHAYDVSVGAGAYAVADDSILVCSSSLPNATQVTDSSDVQGLLTIVGLSLSLAGCAVTLVTYSLFPVLRNVPGVGIMNLSFALFVAQLLFELAPFSSGQDVVCTGLAVVEHYSWLVAFLWMNVLAYDISCTFSSMQAQSEAKAFGSPRFRIFCVYAWGVPALWVTTCLLISLIGDVGFDYVDLDTCWITGGSPLVFAFGIPLALIIIMNIVFFSRTAIALRAAMKIAKRAKSHGDSLARYAVYVKLSSLMGFTWIFGFVAGLAEVDALAYLFIITNSVQGVYICVCFALSARVRKLYKKRLGFTEELSASATSNLQTGDSQITVHSK